MDNLQASDIPDGRGGFMLRDDSAKPRHSEAAPLTPQLSEGGGGMIADDMPHDEVIGENVATSEQIRPDMMQQQEWQEDANSPESALDPNSPEMPKKDAFDALTQNKAEALDSPPDSDQIMTETDAELDANSDAGGGDMHSQGQMPQGQAPEQQATEVFSASSPDSADGAFSSPSNHDDGEFLDNASMSDDGQNGMSSDMSSAMSSAMPNNAEMNVTPPANPSDTETIDPSANALLGKISEMLGSLPKIEQHNPTQHPDNTGKHALATARMMFSPQVPAETTPVLSSTQRRGLQRLAHEEGLRQENIERIIAGSLGYLMPQATPDTIDKDWLSHFFDRARLAADVETQAIWSRVLATKANNPNAQSRKTIAILGEMDRGAQTAFQKLSGYAWRLGYPTLMIYAIDENFFRLSGLSFAEMTDLVAHGLLTIERTAHYVRRKLPRNILVYYGSEPWKLTLPKDNDNVMSLGVASFTRAGIELFNCVDPRENTAIRDAIAEHWRGLGFSLVTLAPTRKNNA